MNTTLYRSTIHPPDTEDRTVLQLPAAEELRELSFTDRLSLRLAVWLFERTQRQRPTRLARPAESVVLTDRHLSARESQTLLAYHLFRQMN